MRAKCLLIVLAASLMMVSAPLQGAVPGPIKVSPNGHYFVDRDGKPFFWLGDTAWPLFSDYSDQQAKAYLRNRATRGFTVVQCVIAWVLPAGNDKESGVPPSSDQPQPDTSGDRPWKDNNPAKPDKAYFKHVDELVNYAEKQGLVLAMLPIWGYYVNQTHLVTAENAREYGRWLGKRYKNTPNIIWVNGGDRVPEGNEAVYRALAEGLREGDGGAHLISYHPCGWHSSSQFWHTESWLDFNMIQTWTDWPEIYPSIAADRMLSPAKPVVLAEGAYENGPEYPLGPITPLIVRRQAWWAVMAGGFPTYGQNQMWRMGNGWDSTFDTPGAAQVAEMKEIVASLNWWDAIPDQSLFAGGVSDERTLNAAMRATDGKWALVYLSTPCRVFLHLDKILTKNVRVTWINPVTGERKDAGHYETGNLAGNMFPPGVVKYFETPGHWEDAVLLLEGY
jgi:Protein of unknown function (DUF4038)/Putative collagen-binding domain of a collagenase